MKEVRPGIGARARLSGARLIAQSKRSERAGLGLSATNRLAARCVPVTRMHHLESRDKMQMPVWLQIVGAALGAIGAILGGVNMWLTWREKKERIKIFSESREMRRLRIHNPTTRPIEIRSLVFETWSSEKGKWRDDFMESKLPLTPFVLNSFTSQSFALSSSQSLDLAFAKRGRLTVRTGSGAEYEKRIPA